MNDLLLIILILIVPAFAQLKVTISYSKYKQIENNSTITGQEVAEKILKNNNLENVYVVETDGNLSDHYDSSRKVVRLSHDIFHGTSIASMSVAAHEVGHAIQDKEGYSFTKIRSLIFPIVNVSTQISYIILFIGILLGAIELAYLGIALTAMGLIFQLITLPVELDASKRAKEELIKNFNISNDEIDGVNKMLGAAAMTYVAGVLASALNILRLLSLVNRD